jgi:GT2 family glycosyltransferase
VCIANWNCRELLRRCLHSLLDRPQGVSLEVIVVDNASDDGSADITARDFPHVRLIRNAANAGFARANNQAVRAARGQYLLFLNNDTVIPEGTLGRLAEYLEAHPEAVMVGPRLRDVRGKVQMSYRKQPTIATFLHRTLLLRWTGLFRGGYRTYRRAHLDDTQARPVEVLMGAALMVRRDEFLRMGAWDEDFVFGGEDLELCARANRRGQVVYVPAVEITHFGRAGTRQNVAYASTHIAVGFTRFFRKSGATRAALFAYKLVVTLDAPLQFLVKGSQFLLRRLWGRRKEAEQSLTAARGAAAFLGRGLWRFWRA